MRTRVVVVSSLARDVQLYPSAGFYVVQLEETLRGVVSIELVHALYDRVTPDRFANLIVREAASTDLVSNCNVASHAFTQLPMMRSLNEYTAQSYRSRHTFPGGALARLDRLTLAFTAPDGSLYPMRDHLLRFEVRTDAGAVSAP